jgi:AmiR/NasT family two-component response regulator
LVVSLVGRGAREVGRTRVEAPVPVARRVVIAEDEAIIRLDLKEILESEGYEVVGETGRGDEAVELVRRHQPDLAIFDVKMPGLDGIEAARQVAAIEEAAVPVLVLTAFSQRALIEEARDAGVAAYLVKPFERGELIPAIEVALARFYEQRAIDEEHLRLPSAGSSLEDKLETRRLVDRAKGVLMDTHGMDEAEAFNFIQKTAMGRRVRMSQVATEVIEGALVP